MDSGSTVFSISLNEIDSFIRAKDIYKGRLQADAEDQLNADLVSKTLPAQFKEYKDIFSKATLNQFPPARSYDHRIKLITENNLRKSPL